MRCCPVTRLRRGPGTVHRPVRIEPEDEPETSGGTVDAAREVCADCPVRSPCLAWALRSFPSAGVWAGLLPKEITALAAAPRNLRFRPADYYAIGEVA